MVAMGAQQGPYAWHAGMRSTAYTLMASTDNKGPWCRLQGPLLHAARGA